MQAYFAQVEAAPEPQLDPPTGSPVLAPAPAVAAADTVMTPRDPVERAIELWFSGLTPWQKVRVQRGLVALRNHGRITVGSMYSGSDVAARVLTKLAKHWGSQMQCDFDLFEHVFQCESDAGKRKWLLEQFPEVPCLFQDAATLSHQKCYDLKTGTFVVVPRCDLLMAGFSCKSRSRANNSSSLNKHCVRSQQKETGLTFLYIQDYVQRKHPSVVLLENVVELAEGGDESDKQYILEWFRTQDYAAEAFEIEASSFGSVARRLRLYFVAVKDGKAAAPRIEYMRSLLGDMRVAAEAFAIDNFLCEPEEVEQVARQHRAHRVKETSSDLSNADTFLQEGWPWPLTDAAVHEACGSSLHLLSPRGRQVAYICHRKWPMAGSATASL